MFDFVRIVETESPKRKTCKVITAKFIIGKSTDIMIRGGDFYAAWLEDKQLWTTDMYDVLDRIDDAIRERYELAMNAKPEIDFSAQYFYDGDSGAVEKWYKFCQKQKRDEYHTLDQTVIFADHEVQKEDYASFKLPYALRPGEKPGYENLVNTLYAPTERHKIEWIIGSIVTGDSKTLQKFGVLYGAAGTGKSTMLNIVEKLFQGYCATFDAKAIGSNNNAFALEAFSTTPLVAIQHDGNLSRIEDNSRLNSLISHEKIIVNEKFKSTYSNSFNTFLLMGTNHHVRITDAKSGLLRRLIDISPSGNKLPKREYDRSYKQVDFELGAIAAHCKDVYLEDPKAYDDYIPLSMMGESNDFYNFMLESYPTFKRDDEITLKQAWEMYKAYVEMARVSYPMTYRVFRAELENYFKEVIVDKDKGSGSTIYRGFLVEKFDSHDVAEEPDIYTIDFQEQASILDEVLADCPAQYANGDIPSKAWDKVKMTLKSLNTKKLHYVLPPDNLIVVDFDLKKDGKKDFEANLKAASQWPPTYAELSKSGAGIHLHYFYDGDVSKLSSIYAPDIEVKVFTGKSSLRRLLTKCNALAIKTISSGLPLKGEQKVVNVTTLKNENHIRSLILKAIRKEVHGYTTPNMDFIKMILDKAYASDIEYDVSDMRPAVLTFAANSTNQANKCISMLETMHWCSEAKEHEPDLRTSPLIFFDCEVFPNLFVVNWKIQGEGHSVVRMIQPTAKEIADLCRNRLVGFNNRRYDNHILYAKMIGYNNEQLFELSKAIVNAPKGSKGPFFREAYNLSYTDIYDFAAKKQSLKKWEIELGIHHQELGLPWDQPVPEELWDKVAEYCDNDVIATETVFDKLRGDWIGREILAALADGSVNDTTNQLTTKLVFGKDRDPQLVYTDLATGKASNPQYQRDDIITAFPGYEYVDGHNMYRGTDVGRGGYILSNPGIYGEIALLDIKSMHPHSAIAMNYFGEHTKRFEELVEARVAIKEGRIEDAKKMLDGKLTPYLEDTSVNLKDLAYALKIAINAVYGQTAASYPNAFRHPDNRNNIVALRGALFMRTLQDEVEEMGYPIVAIKTDSIKIANATPEIIEYCMEFALQYGYEFDHEATYERMCQINDADYIARYPNGEWTSTGARFSHPIVFKTLFSKEPVEFKDHQETKEVKKGAIYMKMSDEKTDNILDNYKFIGRVGSFVAVKPENGGKELFCINEDKISAVTGTKGYTWLEYEQVKNGGTEDMLDFDYYRGVIDEAIEQIRKYGDFENFVSDDPLIQVGPWFAADDDRPPWEEGDEFKKR